MKRRRSHLLRPEASSFDSQKRRKITPNDDVGVTPTPTAAAAPPLQRGKNAGRPIPNAIPSQSSQSSSKSRFFSSQDSSVLSSFPDRATNAADSNNNQHLATKGSGANRSVVSSLSSDSGTRRRKKFIIGGKNRTLNKDPDTESAAVKPRKATHLPPQARRSAASRQPVRNVMHPMSEDTTTTTTFKKTTTSTSSSVKNGDKRRIASSSSTTTTSTTALKNANGGKMKQTTLGLYSQKQLLNSHSELSPMKSQVKGARGAPPPPKARYVASAGRSIRDRLDSIGRPLSKPASSARKAASNSARSSAKQNRSLKPQNDKFMNSDRFDYENTRQYQQLSDEQRYILDRVMTTGGSVFFTGAAGCGKSHLLRTMVDILKMTHGEDRVFVTASTGIAGCNIGGTTVHSFGGIGIGAAKPDELVRIVNSRKTYKNRWKMARVLIIDEISMLEAELLDKLDYVARNVRRRQSEFFGGIQVILVGDFFQLPPVTKGTEPNFCFEANCWKELTDTFVLTKVFRQKNPQFVKILNEMRVGELSREGEAALRACMNRKFDTSDGIEPTQLYPLKRNVEYENLNRLKRLNHQTVCFEASDRGSKNLLGFLDKNCQAPSKLNLKKDAQVVLLKNLDFERNLVNGSRGVVSSFHPATGNPMVRFEGQMSAMEISAMEFQVEQGRDKAIREQIPLNLAFSMSIHKAQGMTLNRVSTSLREVFTAGQAYVSVSRVTSLEGLRLTSFDPRKIWAHPKVKQFYKHLLEKSRINIRK